MFRYIFFFLIFAFIYPLSFQDGYNNYVRGEYEKAIDVFKLLEREKQSSYKNTLWIGKSYFNLGDQKNAILYLIEAVKLNPDEIEAKQLLEQIEHIRAFKQEAEASYHRGYFSFIKAEHEKAKDFYWKAILLDPKVSKYHLWHLRALIGMGELQKARAQLEFAEKLKPYLAPLEVLKKEDLLNVKPDKDYYNLLKSLKEKEYTKEVLITENKDIKKEIEVVASPDTSQTIKPEKIADIGLSDNTIEYISDVPTKSIDSLKKDSSSFQGKVSKIRYSFN